MLAEKTSIEEFNRWLTQPESCNLEFKKAENQFSKDKDLPDYCAALANEGGGILVLGVNDDRIVTGSRAFQGSYNKLSNELLAKLGIRIDVEELVHPEGRVLVFHVPSRPMGRPVKSTGRYTYPMRAGESLVEMDPGTLKTILTETDPDFSSTIVPEFTINDIDDTAINNFRIYWAQKQKRPEFLSYPNEKVLKSVGLMGDDGMTFASLVLFGKKEKIDQLSPGNEIIFEWRQEHGKTSHDFRKNWREPFLKYTMTYGKPSTPGI